MATFSVPVPVEVNVTKQETIINNPTKEVQGVDENLTWALSSLALVLVLGVVLWFCWPKKIRKSIDKTTRPKMGETQEQYEARCRLLPKDTRVLCFFGCKSGREGLTAKSVVSHHRRCNDNPNALHCVKKAA
jgi:hypothetical protein